MTEVMPKVFVATDVAYPFAPQFECGFFDVVQGDPRPGLNLVMLKRPTHEQRRLFVERLLGEMRYQGVRTCTVLSVAPLFVLDGRLTLDFQGICEEYEVINRKRDYLLGPFNEYLVQLA